MEKGCLILIYAVTPIHVGAGKSLSHVDLPVERDTLGYPYIPASSLKGAL